MVTVGMVKSVEGATAKVVIETGASCCENCVKGSCDVEARGIETEAVNLVHAKAGQKVRVDMKTYTYIKGAIILYVLPVVALFAGAFLGKFYLSDYFGSINSDLLSAVGGIFLFLFSLPLVKVLSAKMEKKTEHKSVIESIIEGS
jgi:sigma-E factor negative regulatory protein RseC